MGEAAQGSCRQSERKRSEGNNRAARRAAEARKLRQDADKSHAGEGPEDERGTSDQERKSVVRNRRRWGLRRRREGWI